MSKTTLIRDGTIVTVDSSQSVIDRGYVYIKDGKIDEIAEGEPSQSADTIIDANRCIVAPGIITAHTHLYGILLRGATLNIQPPQDFAQVLQRVWWPVDEALTVDDAYASALSAGAEMLRSGSTFYADTYSGPNSIEGSLEAIARATEELGIRGVIAFEVTERHSPEEAEAGLEEALQFARSDLIKSHLVSMMISVHASFTVSDGLIEKAAAIANRLDVPLTIHASEGLVDLYHNLERYGERTIERLDRLGALGPQTVLAHCVHVNENELDIMTERDVAVVHNPMSNMLNAVGVAPILEMLERGIRVGLGNDGWIFDPFENMRTALTIHRLASGNPSAIGPDAILKMATIDGARCYGVADRLGSVEVGKDADIVVIDGSRLPTPLNAHTAIGHLLNSVGNRDVRDVLVRGTEVVHDHHLTKIDPDKIITLSRKSAQALWKRLG
ncbi:MAG: amidohydrolase family protein [Candidatus Thorarchaeota archaeon]|nr:amidohydrolase family protein [Candidatus Thorarchaeota archaeon]